MNIFLLSILLLIALALLIGLGPYLREARRRPVTEADRAAAPGQFADLSQGRTHYRWYDRSRGPVAVLVHGLTSPSIVWQDIAPALQAQGYRVLVYDLYGRGLSDRPKGPQDEAFFVTQLEDLLADQKIADDITFFGYSMGGAITAAYAARHPDQVLRLVLVAPAGMGRFPGGLMQRMRDAELIGGWMVRALYPRAFRRACEHGRRKLGVPAQAAVEQEAQLRYRGFLPAVLSSLRGILRHPMEQPHRKLSREDVPVLAIWAEADRTIPLECLGTLAQWNRMAVHHQVPGASHWIPLTHPDAVIDAYRQFLATPDAH
ncbi:alpha/beta fold hydrolase [Pseudooceanicola aestuarii]|uniref:alpha/beta fold hydrolase n=1 Tax=Pseudooceanicola aestuarii TaxID=2697319 RepID=UPI0013D8A7BF|nr:alpha/beta hydrolase [Pseudooceanicola aestuarii]